MTERARSRGGPAKTGKSWWTMISSSEEGRVGLIILASFAVILLAALRTSDVVALIALGAVALMIGLTYAIVVNRKRPEHADERSGLCSLAATRNAFLVAISLIAIYLALVRFTVSLTAAQDVLAIIWGVSVGVYLLTYLYCKNIQIETV